MSHDIDESTGAPAMAYVGAEPWHDQIGFAGFIGFNRVECGNCLGGVHHCPLKQLRSGRECPQLAMQ